MKKRFVLITLSAAMVFSFAGCGMFGTSGQNSNRGSAVSNRTSNSESGIDADEAVSIAADDAGIDINTEAIGTSSKREFDDGVEKYEVKIYTPSADYNYDVSASDGKVLSYESETYDNQWQTPDGAALSKDEAINMVIEKISQSNDLAPTDENVRMKSEFDDGTIKYEGSAIYNGKKYEFEINAETGNITEWESENLDWVRKNKLNYEK